MNQPLLGIVLGFSVSILGAFSAEATLIMRNDFTAASRNSLKGLMAQDYPNFDNFQTYITDRAGMYAAGWSGDGANTSALGLFHDLVSNNGSGLLTYSANEFGYDRSELRQYSPREPFILAPISPQTPAGETVLRITVQSSRRIPRRSALWGM